MLALLALVAIPQTTWFVDSSAVAPGDGTIAAPYTRLDHAVAQPTTLDGDTLLVGPGTYFDEHIELGTKGLTITGAVSPGAVVLVGSASGSILTADETGSPVTLSNLTFRGGRGELSASHGGAPVGGAIRAIDTVLTLEACLFDDCTADFGGAMAVESTDGLLGILLVRDTEFYDSCVAAIDGGAIHRVNMTVRVFDSTVRGQALAGRGGAVFSDSFHPAPRRDMHFTDTVIEGTAHGDGGAVYTRLSYPGFERCTVHGRCLGDGRGGCVFALQTSFSNYSDSTFRGGRALWGGALFGHNLRIAGCHFEDNATWAPLGPEPGGGGAICSVDTGIIEDSVFLGNRATHHARTAGGAIYGPSIVNHSTFIDNDASLAGAAFFSFPNSHGVYHLRRSIVLRSPGSTTPALSPGTVAQNNVIDVDPLFWGASDFHLLPGSPAAPSSTSGGYKGAFPYDPYWCGEGCEGPIGLVACVAMPNSSGGPAVISALGSTNTSVDRVVLLLTETPTQPPALLIASQTIGFYPNAGGSSGTLCLGGSILRFPSDALTYEGQTVAYRPVLTEFPMGITVQAGQSWLFQFWFRDTSTAGPTSNFSPALYVPFR